MLLTRKLRRRFRHLRYGIILLIIILPILNVVYNAYNQIQLHNCSKVCPYSSRLLNNTLHFDSSHIIRHYPGFVCPQNFRNLADWIYGWPDQFHERLHLVTREGKYIAPCLPSGSIIYVRIWVINEFFDQVYPSLQNDFVLITGEGDMSSPSPIEYLERSDSKIIHWFGQNGQYNASSSKKFTHLPIGINCYEMADAIETIYSQQLNRTQPSLFSDPDEPSSYIQLQDVSHRSVTTTVRNNSLVLINFDSVTDRTGLRYQILKTVCAQQNKQNFTYATCIRKPAGVHIKKLSKIYERNRQYPFWLSPRGGGLDCHRTWEALYLDIIPIVWNSSLNILYEDLPVVVINDYQELNDRFLQEKLKEISEKKLSNKRIYRYEKLRHAYWRRLILMKSRHKNKVDIHRRTNLCWNARRTFASTNLISLLFDSVQYMLYNE